MLIIVDTLIKESTHQRQIRTMLIGSAVLEWGINFADTVYTRIYLEVTSAGLSLYRKYGWKVVKELSLTLEPHGKDEKELFTLMLRELLGLDHHSIKYHCRRLSLGSLSLVVKHNE